MNKNLLVVDDSPSVRQMVEATLRGGGYQVKTAKDGREALDFCRTTKFDFVLTDQNMPNMDGLTLIRSLRAMSAYTRVPLIVLTTEASDAMKAKGKAAGATGWMVKPFDPQKLLEVVAKVVR
ncbi:response regulator [Marinomonas balearica]|uniref:Response regulator receiver protein n=1 Tax=Marinomonas balearica TaxID=491947 RepID=A0A4R6M4W3_9GAMM|nr:response regulator [Marinomonas balearica]TDO96343.1 response regulator receiver protein [Marinomonas balearica]